MSPEQMQQKSTDKVQQVVDLMKSLDLRIEARERMNKEGFIEKIVFWIDEEKYSEVNSPEVTNSEDDY